MSLQRRPEGVYTLSDVAGLEFIPPNFQHLHCICTSGYFSILYGQREETVISAVQFIAPVLCIFLRNWGSLFCFVFLLTKWISTCILPKS